MGLGERGIAFEEFVGLCTGSALKQKIGVAGGNMRFNESHLVTAAVVK